MNPVSYWVISGLERYVYNSTELMACFLKELCMVIENGGGREGGGRRETHTHTQKKKSKRDRTENIPTTTTIYDWPLPISQGTTWPHTRDLRLKYCLWPQEMATLVKGNMGLYVHRNH